MVRYTIRAGPVGMCGLAALVRRAMPITVDDELAMDMLLTKLAYRGPDASQTWKGDRVLLGHRRLSIIDLSDAGRQPLHAEAHGLHLVFNGEIYNYRELRKELEKSYAFKTETDTEVLLAAYLSFGRDFVTRLRGMFAFVLVDERSGKVMLVRDRMGKKPLYYSLDDHRMVAVSEIKGFHAFADLDLEIDPQSLEAYFTLQYIPGPFTVYRNVRRVMPGEIVELDIGAWRTQTRSYWSLCNLPETGWSAGETIERLHLALQESVKYRLLADVEVGVLLSGGIDSTLISWYAQQQADRPLRAFTVSFGARSLDESPYARSVAKELGMPIVLADGEDVSAEMFEQVVFHADEPLGDPACVPTFAVARALAEHVKVVLSGEGADELFWGYPHYRRDRALGWLPSVRLAHTAAALEESPRMPGVIGRLQKVVAGYKALGPARWTTVFGPTALRTLMASSAHPGETPRFVGQFEEWAAALRRGHGRQYDPTMLDLVSWLPDDLLTKVDRMTMAHSVEARAPFLDHQLVELALSVSRHERTSLWETKRLLRRLVRTKLPPGVSEIVANRKKHGFEVPVDRWMRSELRDVTEEAFSLGHLQATGLVDAKYARGLWDRFVREPRAGHGFARKVWLLLCFLVWHDAHRAHFGFRA